MMSILENVDMGEVWEIVESEEDGDYWYGSEFE